MKHIQDLINQKKLNPLLNNWSVETVNLLEADYLRFYEIIKKEKDINDAL